MKVEITEAQLNAVCNAADTLSGMIGVGSEFDDEAKHTIKMIDRFLKKNGLKRKFK